MSRERARLEPQLDRLRPLVRWLRRVPALDEAVRVIRQQDALDALRAELAATPTQAPEAGTDQHLEVPESVAPYLRYFPPGHFYSPVPDRAVVEAEASRIFARTTELAGIDLRESAQLELFATLAGLAADFTERPGARYRFDNPNYGVGDALMLHAMLRHLRPRRYLEVGSGWSTAMALDTAESHLDGSLEVQLIEPHPELVRALLKSTDAVAFVGAEVQSVDLEVFARLEANDVLFIDCSHVVKVGSDAHFLLTRVLPVLQPGVYVHIHDMFWPFEYPRGWIEEGRAWNEDYFVQAFLTFNSTFEIVLFNHWLASLHREEIARLLPAMLENTGGALWLRRKT